MIYFPPGGLYLTVFMSLFYTANNNKNNDKYFIYVHKYLYRRNTKTFNFCVISLTERQIKSYIILVCKTLAIFNKSYYCVIAKF